MKLNVFVASPADVADERGRVRLVVEEMPRTVGQITSVELELIAWETHSWPDVGKDAQDVINRQIGEYDVFVGIMWRRFGTRTRRAPSGTSEEFDRAYEYHKRYGRPKIMFYFCNRPFYTRSLDDWAQFQGVLEFRAKLESLGLLVWDYEDPLSFERSFREHLMRAIFGSSAPVI